MLESMNAFIRREGLCSYDDRILLAVSGGLDSVVMAELFRQRGQACVIAHADFGLRGEESDQDALFVEALAARYGMPSHTRRFDTAAHASEQGRSIQEAARELRYRWFDELCEEEGCQHVAVAHHLDDQVETFLMNLTRGSGLKGLSGIPVSRDRIIRPLLFADREQLLGFAREQGLEWREDSSNQESKYLRNQVRHELLPALDKTLPGFSGGVLTSMGIIRGASEAASAYATELKKHLFTEDDGTVFIRLPSGGPSHSLLAYLVYEWLSPYGFKPQQTLDALEAFSNGPGRLVRSETHLLETARDGLYVLPSGDELPARHWEVPMAEASEIPDLGLSFRTEGFSTRSLVPGDPDIAMMDLECLRFPLEVRFRRPGDSYRPLGMRGNKKLSDLFIDAKIPVHRKNTIPVILSGERICWVAGFRIGELFKVTTSTEKVLVIEYKKT